MLKKDIRKKYLEKRKTLSEDEVLCLSEKIFQQFITYFNPQKNQNIHIFLSIEKFNEVDMSFFIEYFFKSGIKVFVPKMTIDNLIAVEITQSSDFEKNKWGISEPVINNDSGIRNFDFVIAPLLYCDALGNRIGFGKGFYDRFFAEIEPHVPRIGVNYYSPFESIDDVECTDIPLHYLVTPTEVLSFTGVV